MLLIPWLLFIGGGVTVLGSFIFAIVNMAGQVDKVGKFDIGGFDAGMKRHIYSMIPMLLGGVSAVGGGVWLLIAYFG